MQKMGSDKQKQGYGIILGMLFLKKAYFQSQSKEFGAVNGLVEEDIVK